MSMGGVVLRGIPPGGYNPTPPNSNPEIKEPPTDPNGTKAVLINNHLIIRTLYSSGKQGKIKSRDYFPAYYYLKNLPLFELSLTSSKHNAIGKIKTHIIRTITFSIISFFRSGVIYSTSFTSLTLTRSDITNLFLNRLYVSGSTSLNSVSLNRIDSM